MRIETLSSVRLPAVSISIMAAILRAEGLRADPVFRLAGIDPGRTEGETIYAAQELQFQRGFAAATHNRRGLWLRTGECYNILTYGAYGLSALTAASFHDAILTAIRDDMSYSLGHCRPIERGGEIVGLETDFSEVPPELRDFTELRDAAAIVSFFHDLRQEPFPFSHIELSTSPPCNVSLAERFGCPVVFHSSRTAYHWLPEALRKPLPKSDPVLHAHYRQLWEARLPKPGLAATLVEHIARILRDGASNEDLSLEMQARRMGYTARTLQRRLQDQGVTYREIVSEARNLVAAEMLRTTDFPLAEIGWRLGYSEVAAFSHAFRNWTGASPHNFRRQYRLGRSRCCQTDSNQSQSGH